MNNVAQFTTNCINAVPTSLNRSLALLVKYSQVESRIVKIDAYYPKPLLNAYFGGILATKRTRRCVCRTRKYNCPKDVHAKESAKYEDRYNNNCEDALEGLPPISSGGYMNGNDTACRVLHAPAAEYKSESCAPLGIYSTNTACQDRYTNNTENESFMRAEEMDLYEAFSEENGINPSDGFRVACVDDIDWTSDSGYNCAAVAQAPFQRCRSTLGAEFACAHTCHPQCAPTKQRYSTRLNNNL